MHAVFAKGVGARLRQFKFVQATVIQEEPGQCGWVALCALAARLQIPDHEVWVAGIINVRAPLLLAVFPSCIA